MMLAKLREAKGLRQEDLAEMIGMDKATISRAENMSSTAKLSTYIACAAALKVPLFHIFAGSHDEISLIDNFSQLDVRYQNMILAIAKCA